VQEEQRLAAPLDQRHLPVGLAAEDERAEAAGEQRVAAYFSSFSSDGPSLWASAVPATRAAAPKTFIELRRLA
jgi:hypothetical protein